MRKVIWYDKINQISIWGAAAGLRFGFPASAAFLPMRGEAVAELQKDGNAFTKGR